MSRRDRVTKSGYCKWLAQTVLQLPDSEQVEPIIYSSFPVTGSAQPTTKEKLPACAEAVLIVSEQS